MTRLEEVQAKQKETKDTIDRVLFSLISDGVKLEAVHKLINLYAYLNFEEGIAYNNTMIEEDSTPVKFKIRAKISPFRLIHAKVKENSRRHEINKFGAIGFGRGRK